MEKQKAGRYARKKQKKIGFWCSLPVCIITSILFLPLGAMLILQRLYKKRMIKKRTKSIGMTVVAILFALIIFADTSETPDSQQEPSVSVNSDTPSATETIALENTVSTPEITQPLLPVNELSQYIGQPISVWKDSLDLKFTDVGTNTFQANQTALFHDDYRLFVCTTDSNGIVVKVQLYDSGNDEYTLCGFHTKMDEPEIENAFASYGLTYICDDTWKLPNGTDALYLESNYLVYEQNYEKLDELILKAASLDAFEYQYEDSIGAFYLGNGQVLEFFHQSFAEFVHYYDEDTEYNKRILDDKVDGRYIAVIGSVTSVSEDGKIQVFCQDDEASEAAGLIWPMQGYADVYLIEEQRNELANISVNSQIAVFGRIDADSYDIILQGSFDLTDSILLELNGHAIAVPVIARQIPGIQAFRMDGDSAVATHEKPNKDISDNIAYESYSVDDLIYELENNALRAEQSFQDQYIELTGAISSFDSDGEYFTLSAIYDESLRGTITCTFTDASQRDYLAEKNKGEIITIQCQVTSIGEIMGYSVEVLGVTDTPTYNKAGEYQSINDFWESHEVYTDPMTGEFWNFGQNRYFWVTAGTDQQGNITYILEYPLNDSSDRDNSIIIYSKDHTFTNRSSTITFRIEDYYPEYTGAFVFDLQYTDDGAIYTLYSDVYGVYNSNGEYVDVMCYSDSE